MIIWLASYPRSGNTFLRTILKQCFDIKTFSIYNDKNDIAADMATKEIVGHQILNDNFSIENARKSKKKYYLKTHGLWTPDMEQDKFIYLIRDGREAIVSFKAYIEQYGENPIGYINIIGGNTFVDSWGKHVESWAPLKRPNCILLKFEDFVNSTNQYLDIISEFTERKIVSKNIPSFKKLKSINPKFFRSGKISSWKNKLNEEEQLYFWFKNYNTMIEFGYNDEIPDSIKQLYFIEYSSILKNEIKVQNEKTLKIISDQVNKYNIQIQQKDNELNKKNNEIIRMEKRIEQINKSYSYRIGKFIMLPFNITKSLIKKNK